MKKFILVTLICPLTVGQALYSGAGRSSGAGIYSGYSNSGSCAAPNYCAYAGVDVIPWGIVPDVGGSTNSGATVYDTSFLGHYNIDGITTFNDASKLSPITRVTDAFSVPGRSYVTLDAGRGGSGVFTLTNTNTTLVGVNDSSLERICIFNTTTGHCLAASEYPGSQKPASGIFITTNMNTAGSGSSTQPEDFGSLSFSLTDPTVLYSFGSNSFDISNPTCVGRYTINTSTGMYTVGPCVADFQYGLPAGANAPAWQASHNYPYGAYVTHVLTSAEMLNGGVWAPGLAVHAGDIVAAQDGTIPCMYRATNDGTTAGTTPAFISNPPCKNDRLTDAGGVSWRGTNSTAQFTYQNTGASGTSASAPFLWISAPTTLATDGAMASGSMVLTSASNPFTAAMVGQTISVTGAGNTGGTSTLFTTIQSYQNSGQVTLATKVLKTDGVSGATIALTGHPDMLSATVGDANGIVWTNVGPSYVPSTGNQMWQALGGVSDDTAYGVDPSHYGLAISTNTYGVGGWYNKYNAGQGTGIWLLDYDHAINTYHLLNSATGIWTDYSCLGGSGYNCAGGSWTPTTIGTLTAITNPMGTGQPCPFYTHNEKLSSNGLFAVVTMQAQMYVACNSLQNFYLWQTTSSSFDPAKSLQIFYQGLGHWAIGKNKVLTHTGSAFGYTAGVFATVYDAHYAGSPPSDPNGPKFSVSLNQLLSQSTPQTNPQGCYITEGTTEKAPDCNGSEFIDFHMSWVGDPGTDTWPACGTSYNYANLSPVPFDPWQNMETCYQTYPTYPQSSLPVTKGNVWQFTHSFATGANVDFSDQYQISEYSQDANWLFWSSDWNCQLGSTTGSAPTVYAGSGTYYEMLAGPAVPPNPSSLCGLPWLASTAYVVGNMVDPLENTGGAGGVDDVFQAIYVSGISGPPSSLGNGQPACGSGSCFGTSQSPSESPVTITAASESGTDVTYTSTLNPDQNELVNISGISPSGYSGTCYVTSSSNATSFNCTRAAGLGTPTLTAATVSSAGDTVCDSTSGTANLINPLPPFSVSCPTGIVWQDLGPQTQRGDVFAVRLNPQN